MLFYGLVFLIIILDQVVKFLVSSYFFLGQSVVLVKSLLSLTYVQNTGAAFSLFVGFSSYLLLVGLVVVAVVIYLHYKMAGQNLLSQLALAFILGGSLGNLLDRILHGYVIDYIDFGFWPVFNLADIMINLGVVIFLIYVLRGNKTCTQS